MPAHNFNEQQIKALLEYINNPATYALKNQSKKLFSPNPDKGKNLFIGNLKMKNKGPACISCHSLRHKEIIAGETLGKDLSIPIIKINVNDGNLDSLITTMPTMHNTYKKHEITIEEKSNIEAFLIDARANQFFIPKKNFSDYMIVRGTILAIFILIIFEAFKKFYQKKLAKLD